MSHALLSPAASCGILNIITQNDYRMPNREQELKQLVIDALALEDITPDAIDSEAPLFGAGLGLDSIDVLEIALVISKRYGFQLRSDNADNVRIFASLRALTAYIASQRTK